MLLVVLASGGGSPTARVAETGGLTATALTVIAIFALLVIVGIIYGARQKRIRTAAEEEEQRRLSEFEAQGEEPAALDRTAESNASPTVTKPIAATPPTPSPEPQSKGAKTALPKPTSHPKPAADRSTAPAAAPTEMPKPAEPAPVAHELPRPEPVSSQSPPAFAPTETQHEPVAAPPPPATAGTAPTGYALTDVKGLGPKAATLLTSLGIADVAALAALDPARVGEVDGQLGALAGRMTRDRWVEQARLLAAGDIAAFEGTYGKL